MIQSIARVVLISVMVVTSLYLSWYSAIRE